MKAKTAMPERKKSPHIPASLSKGKDNWGLIEEYLDLVGENGDIVFTLTKDKGRKDEVETLFKAAGGHRSGKLVISKDPAMKSEYTLMKDISIGPKNSARDIRITFESGEPEDNAELLHLLNKKAAA
jgi:hypothetical protein